MSIDLPFSHVDDAEFHSFVIEAQFNSLSNCRLSGYSVNELSNIVFREPYDDILANENDGAGGNFVDTVLPCEFYLEDEIRQNFHSDNQTFSLLSFNIASLPLHFDELKYILLNHVCLDVFGLCETRLSPEIDNLFEIDEYNMYANDRSRRGGGVAL